MLIRRLTLENFRSIESLCWCPKPGTNCLIGPGDGGKTTILDAIALLLQPYNVEAASELDYRDRNNQRGFRIEAVISGTPDEPLIQEPQIPPLRGWKDGELLPLPDEDGAEAVIVCEVKGDQNLDLNYAILPLAGEPVAFSVGMRRKLALARISAMESANRNLRLGVGSMLSRYFKGTGAGGALTDAVKEAASSLELSPEVNDKLDTLKKQFTAVKLPGNLAFGLLPALGTNLSGMLVLSSGDDPASAIPLANAGSGTRNMVLLELSVALSRENPIIVVDEPERGLEPYRQHQIGARLNKIAEKTGQAFISTQAPAILSGLPGQPIWRVSENGQVSSFDTSFFADVLNKQPNALFCRLPIVCEGSTEQGLLGALLPWKLQADLDALGIELVDGGGQPQSIAALNEFTEANVTCTGFLDNEVKHSGARTKLAARIPCFIWKDVVDIERAISNYLSWDQLNGVVELVAKLNSVKSSTYCAQVRDKLKSDGLAAEGTSLNALRDSCGEDAVRIVLGDRMHKHRWFKSFEKGFALGNYLIQIGLPEEFDNQFASWVSSIVTLLGTE